jgi:hypothetical protein
MMVTGLHTSKVPMRVEWHDTEARLQAEWDDVVEVLRHHQPRAPAQRPERQDEAEAEQVRKPKGRRDGRRPVALCRVASVY